MLSVDGERVPSQQVDIPARGSTEVVFPVVFRDSGYHALEARLEGDALAVEDEVPAALAVVTAHAVCPRWCETYVTPFSTWALTWSGK